MKPQVFEKGVVQEPVTALNQKLDAYWVQQGAGKEYDRILASGERIEDGEIAWTGARVQHYQEVQRGFMQRLFKTEVAGSLFHPAGTEVIGDQKPARQGYLFSSLQEEIDLLAEINRRVKVDSAKSIRLSNQKIFMESGVPIRVHSDRHGEGYLKAENIVLSPMQVQAQHKRVLDQIPTLIASSMPHLNAQDTAYLSDLDSFRRERVKWARLEETGGMIADEAGKIGDAWIFVVPTGHPLYKSQKSMYSMNYDDSGLNPYLGILPHAITDRWGALATAHELSHLRDAVLKIEPRQDEGRTRDQYLEGEHKAYSVERALAFAFSKGSLQKALESVVSDAMREGDPIDAINKLLNQRLSSISQSLDTCLEPSAPKSEHELALRQGLYVMLLGFEVARQHTGGNPGMQKQMEKKFIEMLYEPQGLLPKK